MSVGRPLSFFFFKSSILFFWGWLSLTVSAVDLLVVSNSPERLSEPASLFIYPVPARKSLRLLYHHKNVTSIPLRFIITVKATAGSGKMGALLAAAGPVLDEVFAGHKAVSRYWNQVPKTKAMWSLSTQESMLLDVLIKPDEIVSGIFECESDVDTVFESRVIDPEYPDASYAVMARDVTPMVYLSPTMVRDVFYRIGDIVSEIPIGGLPFVRNPLSEYPLKGNYGVTYKIHANLENPDRVARRVMLFFSPVGGIARAVVRLNGTQVLQTGNVGGTGFPAIVELLSLNLPPQSKKNMVLEIIPQSGSYYPVHLVFRSDGPATVETPLANKKDSWVQETIITQKVRRS